MAAKKYVPRHYLYAQDSTVILTLGLSLSSATATQLPGIQAALNKLMLNVGGTSTTIVTVSIVIVEGEF
jgi:hypothetical protein